MKGGFVGFTGLQECGGSFLHGSGIHASGFAFRAAFIIGKDCFAQLRIRAVQKALAFADNYCDKVRFE